ARRRRADRRGRRGPAHRPHRLGRAGVRRGVAVSVTTMLPEPAAARGLATVDPDSGQVLAVYYREPRLGRRPLGVPLQPRQAHRRIETVIESLADPPADVADAYLRLHLLSHRVIRPHEANLDGIFGVLPNVAWTTEGPMLPERAARERARVLGVDK